MALSVCRIGDYEITCLRDGGFDMPVGVLMHASDPAALDRAIGGRGTISIDVNCFLVTGPSGISLVDAGGGIAMGEAFGQARAALAAVGIGPAEIDRVLVTHLHPDHVLGLLNGADAWLPRAAVLVPATDLAYFTDPAARAALPEAAHHNFDITASLVAAYGERIMTLEPGPMAALPGIEMLALPGHSPGHSGFLFHGAPDSLLLWADTVHVQDLQTADPEIGLMFDTDTVQARQTREHLLEQVAQSGWIIGGGHVHGFGRVQRAGSAYSFVEL